MSLSLVSYVIPSELVDVDQTDGNPNMNLASYVLTLISMLLVLMHSFVHTWVPDECTKLMEENLNKVSLTSYGHRGTTPTARTW
jgi:hypothetical protein